MIWLWLTIGVIMGLLIGTLAGWRLCALHTSGYDYEQRMKITRLKSCLQGFLLVTEKYHDDMHLANVANFARQLLKMEADHV